MPPQDDPDDQHRIIDGRYRLQSVLGHGSMGMVWAAYDEFLRRPVAVKEMKLPPGLPSEQAEELRERALREARAIASLSHPNVITLHDVVREDGAPFVVMELLNARSLAGLLADNGPLTDAQAATIGDAVAAALEAAHAAGITHRDVKPGNVLVAKDGRVKLTDFGIARNVSEVTMTSTGLMLGSPAYMAPEVASGKKVTPAADLWGLGATLYAATEGEPPYDADGDPLATANAVVHDDVPQPGPGPLAGVIGELMSKDPDARPAPAAVRAGLHDLRSPAGPLFPAELFTDPLTSTAPPPGPAPAEKAEEPGGGTAPLAADPGPLPFAVAPGPHAAAPATGADVTRTADAEGQVDGDLPLGPGTGGATRTPAPGALRRRSARKPQHRGWAATVFVAVLAAVLFAGAAAGGFAAARTLGGVPILPGAEPQAVGEQAPVDKDPVRREGRATMLTGEQGAEYSIKVPANWSRFVTQQVASARLPASTMIEWVSPDGRRVLGIERFAGFFPARDVELYLEEQRSSWAPEAFKPVDQDSLPEGEVAVYRTVDSVRTGNAGGPPAAGQEPTGMARTTFAHLRRDGSNLWVVSVTVPTDQEKASRTQLFDRLLTSFTIS